MRKKNNDNGVNVPVRIFALLNFIKKNAVGKENKMSCAEIYKSMLAKEAKEDDELNLANGIITNFREERIKQITPQELEQAIWRVRQDIRFIRINFSITICSTPRGYYIPREESEDKLNFLKKHFSETAKTLLASGVSRKELHSILGNLPKGNLTANGQQSIKCRT